MTSVFQQRTRLAWQKILTTRAGSCGGPRNTAAQLDPHPVLYLCLRAGPGEAPALSPWASHAGPALLGCGWEAQKQHYLPRILGGEDY